MTQTILSARQDGFRDIAHPHSRPVDGAGATLPEGMIVVSADNHWGLHEDPFAGRVPARMKDRMPKVFWDEARGLWNQSIDGKVLFDDYMARVLRPVEDRPGVGRIEQRMADLDAEGTAMEMVFPQTLLMFYRWPDIEVREWIFRAYNEYLAEVGERAPGRFHGVGFVNFWDTAKTEASLRQIADLGLKTFVVPIQPGDHVDGTPVHYGSGRMDVLWRNAAEMSLPVYYHVGESLNFAAPGGVLTTMLGVFGPFRRSFAELVFGRVFDRFPALRVIFAEAGINWIPGMLQDAEMLLDGFGAIEDATPDARPTDYWHCNCYATFMADKVGMGMIDMVGPERLLWASDYPHIESTLGFTRQAMEDIVAAVTPAQARAILGGTAIELFGLG